MGKVFVRIYEGEVLDCEIQTVVIPQKGSTITYRGFRGEWKKQRIVRKVTIIYDLDFIHADCEVS